MSRYQRPIRWRFGEHLWRLAGRLTARHVDWYLRLRTGRGLPAAFRARFLAMRLPPETIDRALGEVRRLEDWLPAWNRAAQRFLNEARREEHAGHWREAAIARRNAAMCYHVAHLITDDDPRTVRALRAAAIQSFSQAIPRLLPGVRRVSVGWRTVELPAYLARPSSGAEHAPLAVLLNGATTTKEELLLWADPWLERGIAVLALDWPGTGEAARGPLTGDCDDLTDGILALVDAEGLDAARVALVGFSLGGVIAVKAAALDRRIDACIAVTPPFDPGAWLSTVNPLVRQQLLSLTGKAGDVQKLASEFTLRPVIGRLRAPLLVFGAGRDLIVPPDEALHLAAAAGEWATLVWYPRGFHGLYELIDDWTAVAAEWLAALWGVPAHTTAEQSTQVDAGDVAADGSPSPAAAEPTRADETLNTPGDVRAN
jgi:2,6-dihydroxypseudooxynicotine hydrolase